MNDRPLTLEPIPMKEFENRLKQLRSDLNEKFPTVKTCLEGSFRCDGLLTLHIGAPLEHSCFNAWIYGKRTGEYRTLRIKVPNQQVYDQEDSSKFVAAMLPFLQALEFARTALADITAIQMSAP